MCLDYSYISSFFFLRRSGGENPYLHFIKKELRQLKELQNQRMQGWKKRYIYRERNNQMHGNL
jgi:hypothetical protein